MAHIINKSFVRLLAVVICLALAIPSFGAKPLKEKDYQKLVTAVKQRYAETMMQGAEVMKIGGKNILVSVVGAKKGPSSQRVAQVKAARTAGEYLQVASNKSVTVYEVTDKSSYSLQENASETGSTHNSATSSVIDQNTSDVSTTETSEKFTDRMVQSSFTQVNHIQPLCNLGMTDGEIIYAYYMIME